MTQRTKLTMRFICAIVTTIIGIASYQSAMAAGWEYHKGKGYVVCDAVMKRIKQYHYVDPLKNPNSCVWNVVATYPGFKEPPWQELDPKRHEELIYKLMKYQSGAEVYFDHKRPSLGDPEGYWREQMRKFLDKGGRVQMLRTMLFRNYEDMTPAQEQTVIQLFWPSDSAYVKETCPGFPIAKGRGNLFIVTDDLEGPDRRFRHHQNILALSELRLFNKQPHLVGMFSDVLISRDVGSGSPSPFCELEYKE